MSLFKYDFYVALNILHITNELIKGKVEINKLMQKERKI